MEAPAMEFQIWNNAVFDEGKSRHSSAFKQSNAWQSFTLPASFSDPGKENQNPSSPPKSKPSDPLNNQASRPPIDDLDAEIERTEKEIAILQEILRDLRRRKAERDSRGEFPSKLLDRRADRANPSRQMIEEAEKRDQGTRRRSEPKISKRLFLETKKSFKKEVPKKAAMEKKVRTVSSQYSLITVKVGRNPSEGKRRKWSLPRPATDVADFPPWMEERMAQIVSSGSAIQQSIAMDDEEEEL